MVEVLRHHVVVVVHAADVEPDHVRVVAVDQLDQLRPLVVVYVVASGLVAGVGHWLEGVRVARGVAHPRVVRVEPLGQRVVQPVAQVRGVGARRGEELLDDVAFRAELDRVASGDLRVPKGEPLVMLGRQHVVLSARVLEQLDPALRVPLGGGEHRDEVVVVEALAVRLRVVGVRRIVGILQVLPVPLGVFLADRCPAGHRVDAPVDEDAELGVVEPVRRLVGRQGRVGSCVVGHAEGERGVLAADDAAAVPGEDVAGGHGARRDARVDADAQAHLIARGERADLGRLDGAGAIDVHLDVDRVASSDPHRPGIDDGGLDRLRAGVVQHALRRPGVAQQQRLALRGGLHGQGEHVQARCAGRRHGGDRQGERDSVLARVE